MAETTQTIGAEQQVFRPIKYCDKTFTFCLIAFLNKSILQHSREQYTLELSLVCFSKV